MEKTDDVESRITKITESKLLDVNLRVPISAKLHPDAIEYLSKNCNKNEITIALLLVKGLKNRAQNNTVTVSQSELASRANVTKPTVTSATQKLEDLHLIKKLGRQTYKIEPILAWFGSEVSWAIALKECKDKGRFGYGEVINDTPRN